MTDVFFVDISGFGEDTGIKTYIRSIAANLPVFLDNEIRVNCILLNSSIDNEFAIITENSITTYHIPLPFGNPHILRDPKLDYIYSKCVAEVLSNYINKSSRNIFHFNWLNHSVMAGVFQSYYECATILTSHCVTWKREVHSNYNVFLKFEKVLKDQVPDMGLIQGSYRFEMDGYRNFDAIVAVTQSGKNSLVNVFGVPPDRIKVIYNGVAQLKSLTTDENTDKIATRRRWGFSASEKIVVIVGRPEKLPGIAHFIQAVEDLYQEHADLDRIRLIVVGNIDYARLVSGIKQFWGRITLVGYLNFEKLLELYRMADVGVIPSLYEQCSYVALEMMSVGLPIICSNIDGLNELIRDGYNGRTYNISFQEGGYIADKQKILQLLKEVLYHPDNLSAFSNEAQSCTLQNFDAKIMCQRLADLYKSLN